MGGAREATGRLSAVRLDESVNLIYDTQLGGWTGGGLTKQDVILHTAGLENVTPRWLAHEMCFLSF